MPSSTTPMKIEPITVPPMFGRFAPNAAMPISAAATACSRYGSPTDTSPRPRREVSRIAPTAAHSPEIT